MAEDIGPWLARLGLAQYARAFADNGIDMEALPHIRDEDFERLGILLGQMRRLQVAIETLSANLVIWTSNDGQIIKSGLSDGRRAIYLPSVAEFAYDWLRIDGCLGNVG